MKLLAFAVVIAAASIGAADAEKPAAENYKKEGEEIRKQLNELTKLREENETLKKQVAEAQAGNRTNTSPEVDALKKDIEGLRGAINRSGNALAFKKGQILSVIAVKTSKEEAETFVKAFTEGPKASHKMKGFLGLAVSENLKEPASFLVISLWENEDALNGYVKSKAFGEDHARMMEIKSAKTEAPGRYVIKED